MATFVSRFGWEVTGTVQGYETRSGGCLEITVMSVGGVLVSFPAADVVVTVD